jgi:hypothetical protein
MNEEEPPKIESERERENPNLSGREKRTVQENTEKLHEKNKIDHA